ncbi:MAG: aldo/keto reductase [Anaerolineales bacterium]
MQDRLLGKSGIKVSPMGFGCWAIGGPWWYVGEDGDQPPSPSGWGLVDDRESIRSIHLAIDLGINFFDTADAYGCGHSEEVLGKALSGRRDQVVLATKFGKRFDVQKKLYFGHKTSPELIRQACEDSLRRLDTDYIDLYQFHWGDYDGDTAMVEETLESLVQEGKIRAFGWSTDSVKNATAWTNNPNYAAVQFALHAAHHLGETPRKMIAALEQYDLAGIIRGPLAMGLLSGKFNPTTTLPENDIRSDWNFSEGRISDIMLDIKQLSEVLTSDGRTLVQGAIAWLWARSERLIPIPGFRNERQVKENAGALKFGPLTPSQFQQVEEITGRAVSAQS